MARRARRTMLEKLQDEYNEVIASIEQYKSCIATMEEKKQNLSDQIELEELKSLKEVMDERKLSVDDLKDILDSTNTSIQQGA